MQAGKRVKRGVRVNIGGSLAFPYHLSVPEDVRREARRIPVIPADVVKESGFGPLKALLRAISTVHTDRGVRRRFALCN